MRIKNINKTLVSFMSKLFKFNTYKYGKFLYTSSFWLFITFIISFNTTKDILLTLYYLLVFITSINYWRKPEEGIRKTIDLLCVYIGLVFALIKIYSFKDEFNMFIALSLYLCIIIFYIIEFILAYFICNQWVLFHMTLHLYCSIIGLIIVYDNFM
jgi:hypothetical protein